MPPSKWPPVQMRTSPPKPANRNGSRRSSRGALRIAPGRNVRLSLLRSRPASSIYTRPVTNTYYDEAGNLIDKDGNLLDHSGRPRRPDSPSSIYSRPFDSASIFPRAPSHSPDYCGTPQPEPWPESPHYYSTASPDPRSQSPDNRETQYSESGSGSPVDCGAEPSAESPAATNPLTTEEHQVCYTSFPSFEEQQPQPEEEETQIEEEKPQIEKEEPQIVPEGISTLKDLADLSDSLAKLIEHRQKSEAPKATPAYKKLSGASFLPAAFEEATGLSVEEFISSPVTAREIKKYRREVNRLYSTDCEVDRTITLLQGLQEHHATDRSSSLLSDDDSLFDDFDPSLLPLPLKIRRHRQGHQTRYSTQRCAPRIKPKLDELIGPIEGSSPSDPFGPSPSRHGSFSPNSQISLGIGEFLRTTEPPPPIVLNAGSSIDRSESRSSFRSSSLLARAARSFSSGSWKKFVRKGSKAKLTPLPEESNLSSLARSSNSTTLVRNSQNSQNSQDDGSLIRFDSSTLTSRSPPAHPSLSILEEKTEPSSSDEPLSLHPRRLRAASNLPGTPRQLFEDSYPMTLSRTRNAKKRISSVLDEDIEPTEVANEDPDLSDDDAWLSDPVLDPPVQFSGGAFQRPVSSLVASVCNYDGADDAEEQTDDWQDIPDHIDGEFNGPEQIQTHGEDSDIQTVTNTRKRKVKPSKKALTARNEDDDDDGAYKASKPTKAKAKKNTRPAKRRRDLYNDEGTLFSAKSKLLNGDLRKYFTQSEAWDLLDEQEKAELRQAFGPIEYDENGKPSEYFLNYNAEWRRDLRYFDEDLANGQHESDWLDEAKEAMEERASGGFDNWKEQNFEEFWGQKYRGEDQANEIQRDEPVKGKKRSNRGKEKRQDDRAEEKPRDILEGQEMPNLKRLALDRMVDTGDVFRYVRHFGPKNASHILEKDIELSNVEYDTGYITFSIPGGQRKLNAESASNVKDSNGTGPDASSATTQDETKLEHGTAQPTITKSETESMVESSTVQLNNASSRVEDIPDAEVLETITVRPTTAPKADSEAHTKTPASTRFLSPPPSDRPVQKRYLSRTNQRSVSEIHEEHKKAKKATELARLVNQPTIHPLPDFLAVSSSGYSLRSTRRSTEKDDPITPDTKSLSVLAKPDSGSSRQVSTASELVAPVTERLDSLEALEKRIHAIDGRPAYVRSYKPWTSFNIIRGGIDIGTLENLRREYMRTLLLNI